jgi:hypothetical protein
MSDSVAEKCKAFCKSFFFIIVSLVTIGVAVAVFAGLVALCVKYRLKEIDTRVLVYSVIGLVASIIVFVLAIVISVARKRCLLGTLSVVFLIFALAMLGAGITGFAFKKKILNTIALIWDPKDDRPGTLAVRSALEQSFDCCHWNSSLWPIENCSVGAVNCSDVIEPDYNKYSGYGFGGLIGFGVILLLCVILGFFISCSKTNIDYEAVNLQSSASQDWYTDAKPGNQGGEKRSYHYAW